MPSRNLCFLPSENLQPCRCEPFRSNLSLEYNYHSITNQQTYYQWSESNRCMERKWQGRPMVTLPLKVLFLTNHVFLQNPFRKMASVPTPKNSLPLPTQVVSAWNSASYWVPLVSLPITSLPPAMLPSKMAPSQITPRSWSHRTRHHRRTICCLRWRRQSQLSYFKIINGRGFFRVFPLLV